MPCVYHVFETDMGWVGIAGAEGTISRLVLPAPSRDAAERMLRAGMDDQAVETKHDFSGAADDIRAYFRGERVDFTCGIETPGAGTFDREIREAARAVGYGEVTTYGKIAVHIGRPGAARAVGQALGRNPVPLIVPCHRVLRSDGTLGGFRDGLEWKLRLLGIEGIEARSFDTASRTQPTQDIRTWAVAGKPPI